MKVLLLAGLVRGIHEGIYFFSPVLVGAATFLTDWGLGRKLDASRVFSTLTLFNILQVRRRGRARRRALSLSLLLPEAVLRPQHLRCQHRLRHLVLHHIIGGGFMAKTLGRGTAVQSELQHQRLQSRHGSPPAAGARPQRAWRRTRQQLALPRAGPRQRRGGAWQR